MAGHLTLLVAVSLGWAAGYLFIGGAKGVPPITATATMTSIAAPVILLGVGLARRRPLLATLRARPLVPVVMGFTALALPQLSVVVAEEKVPPELATLIGTTVPIATILLTMFVTREHPVSPAPLAGTALAIAGLVVFVGGPAALTRDVPEVTYALVMMAGGLVFALNGLYAARAARTLDPEALAAWTIVFGALALVVAAAAVERPDIAMILPAIWPLVGEGVIGMGLAYLGYYVLVARAGPGVAALYAFLVPVLGVALGAIVYGQPVTLHHAAGLALVLVGLALILGGPRQRRPATP